MQANSGKPETNSVVVDNNNGPGNNDSTCLPDSVTTNNQSSPNLAQSSASGAPGNNSAVAAPQMTQPTQQHQHHHQHQQHLRPPNSPGQQQAHMSHLQQQQQHQSHGHNQQMANHNPNLTPNHHHMAPNVHHYVPHSAPGAYHQRHQAQSYLNQQQHQQMHQQQYHQQHQSSKHPYNNQRGDSESDMNHVLLITVINPHYNINHDLIHQICSSYGKVNRIVIFRKNGVQAMVEFDNVDSAKRAKSSLNGCDIYSGCCTLRIEYAKPTRLNIHKNDNDSFDYTNPNLDNGPQEGANPIGWAPNELSMNNTGGGSGSASINATGIGATTHQQQASNHSHTNHPRGGIGGRGGGRGGGHHGGPHHFHPNHHHHTPSSAPHHHLQAPVPLTQVPGQAQHGGPGYNMVTPLDQTTETTDAFHQDAGFNLARGGAVGGQPPSAYVDPYLNTHGGGLGHTALHGHMYPRQDSHGHQPNHTRSNQGSNPNHSASFSPANVSNALMPGQPNLTQHQGVVVMVYGLQLERVNCDRLFNLFCLYGNVVRVKFLRTKDGCAMVQLGDDVAAERCVTSLNKITLFEGEIQISYSKQPYIHDVVNPFILPDGSPSFKDFSANKNNRFKNPEVASKNRILPPSQVLHFFNAPFGITEDELVHLFKNSTGHEPVSVKIFTPKADNIKSYSGLVTFKDPAEATETLVICNHLNMPKLGAPHPYILRLCFSPPTYMRPGPPYPPANSN